MNLRQLFEDEDAVSPVIGVILMVAITVILAAVIGTFVLGLGENVQDSAPQANLQFEYGGDWTIAAGSAGAGTVDITHTGGEDVEADQLAVQIAGTSIGADLTTTGSGITQAWPATVETGSTLVYDESQTGAVDGSPSDTVRVVWTSPSGSNSNTIGQSTIPS